MSASETLKMYKVPSVKRPFRNHESKSSKSVEKALTTQRVLDDQSQKLMNWCRIGGRNLSIDSWLAEGSVRNVRSRLFPKNSVVLKRCFRTIRTRWNAFSLEKRLTQLSGTGSSLNSRDRSADRENTSRIDDEIEGNTQKVLFGLFLE